MQDITYRTATVADTNVLVDYRMLLLDAVSGVVHSDEIVTKLRQDLAIYFPKAIEDGSYISWLALDSGNVVAVAGVVIYDRPVSYKCPNGKVGYILNMYTLPEYRRQGICTLLMNKIHESARKANVSTLALHASPDGEPLYRKYGFNEPGNPYLELNL